MPSVHSGDESASAAPSGTVTESPHELSTAASSPHAATSDLERDLNSNPASEPASEPTSELESEPVGGDAAVTDTPVAPRASTLPWLDRLSPWLLGLAAIIARLATGATGPTDWDSAQYASGVLGFDVTHGRPQPPGYWLYVMTGRAIHVVSGAGAVPSLVVVAAIASGLAVALVVIAGRDLYGRWVGLGAGVVMATSPFVWFSGSIVASYSFDLLAAPALIILAWRARPHSWHGAVALATLGLLAGFRQSIIQAFVLLALLAVAASVRRIREGIIAVGAFAAAVAVWFLPMALMQPGGISTWVRATRAEATGAAQATSVLVGAPGGAVNLGAAAAALVVALAPLAVVALVSAMALGVRRLRASSEQESPSDAPRTPDFAAQSVEHSSGDSMPVTSDQGAPGAWERPWFQSRTSILIAAIVPPLLVISLVQFAKGGYLLSVLPGATIALLALPAQFVRSTGYPSDRRTARGTTASAVVVSVLVLCVAALGVQRFLADPGVLPPAWVHTASGPWFVQPRYQAPYPQTRSAIDTADAVNASLATLGVFVHPSRDVVVLTVPDGGSLIYRNAGWELPQDRVALIDNGVLLYNQLHRSLFYASGRTIEVGPGGVAYFVASPALRDLYRLTGTGAAGQVLHARPIGGFLVFRVRPGSSVLGVTVRQVAGPRPLGHGL